MKTRKRKKRGGSFWGNQQRKSLKYRQNLVEETKNLRTHTANVEKTIRSIHFDPMSNIDDDISKLVQCPKDIKAVNDYRRHVWRKLIEKIDEIVEKRYQQHKKKQQLRALQYEVLLSNMNMKSTNIKARKASLIPLLPLSESNLTERQRQLSKLNSEYEQIRYNKGHISAPRNDMNDKQIKLLYTSITTKQFAEILEKQYDLLYTNYDSETIDNSKSTYLSIIDKKLSKMVGLNHIMSLGISFAMITEDMWELAYKASFTNILHMNDERNNKEEIAKRDSRDLLNKWMQMRRDHWTIIEYVRPELRKDTHIQERYIFKSRSSYIELLPTYLQQVI